MTCRGRSGPQLAVVSSIVTRIGAPDVAEIVHMSRSAGVICPGVIMGSSVPPTSPVKP